MRLVRKRDSAQRLGSTASDAAGAVAEVIGSGVRSAGESVVPVLAAASRQVPELASRLAEQMQPVADSAQRRAAGAADVARGRTSELADRVVQAAYEATKSLPPETRDKVQRSLSRTGVKLPQPAPPPRRRISKKWMAAGLFAAAGVAFLFSGTVQDRVYDLVDRLRGEDLDAPLGGFASGTDGDRPQSDAGDPGEPSPS